MELHYCYIYGFSIKSDHYFKTFSLSKKMILPTKNGCILVTQCNQSGVGLYHVVF